MGQKTNPIGFRLAVNKDWRSKWYAGKKDFGKLLTEDRKIRDLLKKRLETASVPKILIERAATRTQAVKALRALAAQGEAPHLREDDTGEPSHFERFIHIYKEFKVFKTRNRSSKPIHAVPRNPTTRVDFHRLKPKDMTYIGIDDHGPEHKFERQFSHDLEHDLYGVHSNHRHRPPGRPTARPTAG